MHYKKVPQDKETVDYNCKRALIQSNEGGKHLFVTEGTLSKQQNGSNIIIHNTPTFEGWRYVK